MVYEYVAVERKDVGGEWTETIIAEGKVVAYDRDKALLQIGASLGNMLTDYVEVNVRPF